MAYIGTTLGYTTVNDSWETLTDKELAIHDLLMVLHTRRGECDWDPDFGASILDKMFRPKTDQLKIDIMNEISDAFNNDPRLTLNILNALDIDNGWIFYCEISYLDGIPENWSISVTKDEITAISNGTFPLGES
jgi:phage baseplate assembly protein W